MTDVHFRMFIAFYYCVGIASILVLSVKRNKSLLLHGKSLASDDQTFLVVPKRYFSHFYISGFLFNLYIWLKRPNPLHLYFTANILRRLIETTFLMRYSGTSRMHVLHYLAGLTFYPVTGMMICQNGNKFTGLIFGTVFVLLSWMQLDSHHRLAHLRHKSMAYQRIPPSGLFSCVLCPHYGLEVLIYVVILSKIPSLESTLCLVFISTNLFTSAYLTKEWHNRLFKDKRWAIIPRLL